MGPNREHEEPLLLDTASSELPKSLLVWQTHLSALLSQREFGFVCVPFSILCLTLRESACFPSLGWEDFSPKGRLILVAFMKRLMMYGKVEHRIPKLPLACFFVFN